MTTEFDPRKSYLTLKAHEKMIAYIGFRFQSSAEDTGKEGIIKISGFYNPCGGGQLTLTFIVDTEGDGSLKARLNDKFSKLSSAAVRPKLGKNFERIVKVSLDSLAQMQNWYVEEVNVHFRSITERENVLIEEMLIPALEDVLHFSFDTVEWWPENLTPRSLSSEEIDKYPSIKALFKKWFS